MIHNQEEVFPNDDYSRFAADDYREVKTDYKGKGPKGYHQSDERVWENACEALMNSPFVDATEIVVVTQDGKVILEGEVSHEQEKQAASEAVKSVLPSFVIENEIKVIQKTRGVLDRVSGNPESLNLVRN